MALLDSLGRMPAEDSPKHQGKLNQSVRKAITVLRAVADDENANVSTLARAAGLPRATALRLIQTLEEEGFLVRMPGEERVLLGPELFRLTRGADAGELLQEVARPVIADLVAAVNESVTFSVVSSDGGLDVVDQVNADTRLGPRSWIGERFTLHTSATGKVLLASWDAERLSDFLTEPLARHTPNSITSARALQAELRNVEKQGYAVVRDEEEEGLTSFAAGVHGQSGRLLGVVAISGPTQRLDRRREKQAVPRLLRAIGAIEARLRPA